MQNSGDVLSSHRDEQLLRAPQSLYIPTENARRLMHRYPLTKSCIEAVPLQEQMMNRRPSKAVSAMGYGVECDNTMS